jgi:hypothetical protein
MRSLPLSILLLGIVAHAAGAAGVVDLAWNGCTGPVDRAVVTGDQPELYLSVLGMGSASLGYTIKLRLSTPFGYPDAWRFDPNGCEPFGSFQAGQDAPPAVAATCPPMHGSVASILSKSFSYDAGTGTAAIVLGVGYPGPFGGGNPVANPAQRYHLGVVRLVMTNAVTGPSGAPQVACGGLEKPMCITTTSAEWSTPAGATNTWAVGNASITANDPQNASQCPGIAPTVARPSTWGAIRSQYRL